MPAFATEPVQRDEFIVAAIAREDVDVLDRDIELVATSIFQCNAIVRALADRNRLQPDVAPDPVIHMDHQIAWRERGQLGQEGIGALAASLAADKAVTKDVLFGDQFQFIVGKAVLERQDQCDRGALGCQAQRFLPAVGQDRGRAGGFAQDRRDPGAAAFGIGCDQRLAPALGLAGQVLRGGFVNVVAAGAFRGKVAAPGKAEIDH